MNLIYICVFHQTSYINLLKLLICSISKKTTNIHILISTSPTFHINIEKELSSFNLVIMYQILDLNTLMEASSSKLNIFQYKNIDLYTKILYLDTDILINGDLHSIFNLDTSPNKLYALEEGTISNAFWGAQFFKSSKINKNLTAFSAGVLYFHNSISMKSLFKDINKHMETHIEKSKISKLYKMPLMHEQPFIVYNAINQNKYDNQLFKKYVENNPINVDPSKIIYHFPGGPGNYISKYEKMTSFWKKIEESLPIIECHLMRLN